MQILSSVIKKTAVNITDSLPKKDIARQQTVFNIRLFRVDILLSMAIQTLVGLGHRIVEASHSEKPHLVEILWTIHRPDAETYSYSTHKTNNRQTYMSLVRFEPAFPGSQMSWNQSVECATTGIDMFQADKGHNLIQ